MATVVQVESGDHPGLGSYWNLRDVALRRHLEADQGFFVAEGEKVIRRALAAGYVPRSLLLAPRWWAGLKDEVEPTGAVVMLASEELIESVTGFHVHRGALGAFERRERWRVADLVGLPRLVVAEDLVDHTNVGALLRAAAGLGWDGALLSPRCADPLYRRAIKVSMGAAFTLPWARMSEHHGSLTTLRAAGYRCVALALREDAVPLHTLAASLAGARNVALVVGTEGDGLSSAWLSECDDVAVIPMHRGIDSLNVASAAAVACHALGPSPQHT